MILNLLRVDALRVEDMIKKSFSESKAQSEVPKQQARLKELTLKLEAWNKEEVYDVDADELQLYYTDCREYWTLQAEMQVCTLFTHLMSILTV